jgi:hypothetical protein
VQGLKNAVVYQLASAGQPPATRVFKHPCLPRGLPPSTLVGPENPNQSKVLVFDAARRACRAAGCCGNATRNGALRCRSITAALPTRERNESPHQ